MDALTIIIIIALILSVILHEAAHGYAANWLGDPTARLEGRLTLNPAAHIDPVGSVMVPAFLALMSSPFLFGWAKPVPYNPYNLKNQRWGEAIVAAAGPATNLFLALVFAILVRSAETIGLSAEFVHIAVWVAYLNVLLAIFNMIPFPPLDGSKVFAALLPYRLEMRYRAFVHQFESYGIMGMFVFIFLLMFVFGAPFFGAVRSVTVLLTGLPM